MPLPLLRATSRVLEILVLLELRVFAGGFAGTGVGLVLGAFVGGRCVVCVVWDMGVVLPKGTANNPCRDFNKGCSFGMSSLIFVKVRKGA